MNSYEIKADVIYVKFNNSQTYVYSYGKAGEMHVDEMKKLAQAGVGLNTYINKYVKFYYD